MQQKDEQKKIVSFIVDKRKTVSVSKVTDRKR